MRLVLQSILIASLFPTFYSKALPENSDENLVDLEKLTRQSNQATNNLVKAGQKYFDQGLKQVEKYGITVDKKYNLGKILSTAQKTAQRNIRKELPALKNAQESALKSAQKSAQQFDNILSENNIDSEESVGYLVDDISLRVFEATKNLPDNLEGPVQGILNEAMKEVRSQMENSETDWDYVEPEVAAKQIQKAVMDALKESGIIGKIAAQALEASKKLN